MTSPDWDASPRPANFTRRTADLVGKFRRKRQWHLIALYHLLRLSDFGREGIERSGSYRFADHLYRNRASGRGLLGRWLDRRLLNLPASRAMRRRYIKAVESLRRELEGRAGEVRVLAVPCGIPRDVTDLVKTCPQLAGRLHYTGMDLDPEVVTAAREHLKAEPLGSADLRTGNALERDEWPEEPFDLVISTGLGEFLGDAELKRLYRNVFDSLVEGGVFYTSATAFERRSDWMLRTFELQTHYRSELQLGAILRSLPWSRVELEVDPGGLQTFVRAVK